jgi:hypothetical protein
MKEEILFKPCTSGTGRIAGSCKQGNVEASFADLEEMFGEPAFEGKGDKITTEFVVDYEYFNSITRENEYGQFCLYDWHYARDFNDDYKKITWNIGGKGFMAVEAVDYAMMLFEKTDIREEYEQAVLCHANWHTIN